MINSDLYCNFSFFFQCYFFVIKVINSIKTKIIKIFIMRVDYRTNMVINSNNNKKNVENSKIKNENKDVIDSTKKDSINISSPISKELDNKEKEKEKLSYYERQVLKELKGIKKTSKNILKSIKKFSS